MHVHARYVLCAIFCEQFIIINILSELKMKEVVFVQNYELCVWVGGSMYYVNRSGRNLNNSSEGLLNP